MNWSSHVTQHILLVVFGYLWPVLPITGGTDMNLRQAFDFSHVVSILKHSILPAARAISNAPIMNTGLPSSAKTIACSGERLYRPLSGW